MVIGSDPQLIAKLERSVEDARQLLNDTKATKRKEGVKHIETILSSPDYLRCLDDQTARLQPEDRITKASWPCLVHTLARHVMSELDRNAGKSKLPDAAISKTFKKLINAAEASNRRALGLGALLQRCAAFLFRNVSIVLQHTTLSSSSQLGNDFFAVLRIITNEPLYCAAAAVDDWRCLVDVHLKFLGGSRWPGDLNNEDARRAISSLSTLLRRYPGEPSPDLRFLLVQWLLDVGRRLSAGGKAAQRFVVEALDAAVNFLALCGRDVSSHCPSLHCELHTHVLAALHGRDSKAKDRAVTYLRMQLTLGGVTARQLRQLQRWGAEEESKPQWKAASHVPVSTPLQSSQYSLLCLLADLYAHEDGQMDVLPNGAETTGPDPVPQPPVGQIDARDDDGMEAPSSDDATAEERPAKRARVVATHDLGSLGGRAASSPPSAAPVACTVLLRYTNVFPFYQHKQWVEYVSTALPGAISQATAPEPARSGHLLWLLRLVHALAISTRTDASGALQSNETAWRGIWDALVQFINEKADVDLPEHEMALWGLAAIAKGRLFPVPVTAHKLWGVALLERRPTPAAVALATAALHHGSDSAAHAGLWEDSILRWLVHSVAVQNPSCDVASAIHAYLRLSRLEDDGCVYTPSSTQEMGRDLGNGEPQLPSFGLHIAESSHHQWVWWVPDTIQEHAIANLVCGVAYMRAKATSAAACIAEQKRTQRAIAAAVPRLGAGLQMHQFAAQALAEAVSSTLSSHQSAADDEDATHTHSPGATELGPLAAMLSVCSVAIRVSAAAALVTAKEKSSSDVPACWRQDAPLGRQVQEALRAASKQLVEVSCTPPRAQSLDAVSGLSNEEENALERLLGALKTHGAAFISMDLSNSLSEGLRDLKHTFALDPQAVAAAAAAAATQTHTQFSARTGAFSAAVFDDELDMGAPMPTLRTARSTRQAAPPIASSGGLAELYKQRCATLLCRFAPIVPLQTARSAFSLLNRARSTSHRGNAPPPPMSSSIRLSLVEAAVTAVASAIRQSAHESPELAVKALNELEQVLGWSTKKDKLVIGPPDRLRLLVDLLFSLASALSCPHGLATTGKAVNTTAELVRSCLELCETSVEHTTCALRISIGNTAAEILSFAKDDANRVMDWVASLVADPCYTARLAGSRLLQRLLPKFQDPGLPFFNVRDNLLALHASSLGGAMEEDDAHASSSNSPPPEHVETALFFLGETAAAQGALEIDCMLSIAQEAVVSPAAYLLALTTVDWVALSLSYPDRFSYASWMRPRFMYAWIAEAGQSVEALLSIKALVAPTPICQTDARAFLRAVAPSLVGAMVLTQDRNGLEMLATKLGQTLHQLLQDKMEGIMSLILPGWYSQDEALRKTSCELHSSGVLVDVLGMGWEKNISNVVVNGIGYMLAAAYSPLAAAPGSCAPAEEPLRPFYRPETVVEAIKHLPRGDTPEQRDALLWTQILQESQVADILRKVQVHVQAAKHPRHMTAALGALHAALLLLGPRVSAPATFRYAVSILLRLMKYPLLRSACCDMLQRTLAYELSNLRERTTPVSTWIDDSAFPSLLPAVASSLVSAVQQATEANEDAGALLHLLNYLTDCPPPIGDLLALVDDMPATAGMERAAQAVQKAKQKVTLSMQLSAFTQRVASLSHSERKRSINAMRASLADLTHRTHGEVQLSGRCTPELASSAWKLALLSSDLRDPQLAEFSAEFLAVIGPLEPSALSFDPSSFRRVAETSAHDQSTRSSSVSTAEMVRSTWMTALRFLSDYLLDEDTEVVRDAQNTLRWLLRTPAGRACLGKTSGLMAQIVVVFAPSSREQIDQETLSNSNTATNPAEEPALWNLQEAQGYEEWICGLAHALCARADAAPIHACRRIVRHKPAFAELVLPLAFSDLALHHTDDARQDAAVSGSIAHLIAEGLLPACTRHPKAMKLLLRCFNHLRGLRLDAIRGNRVAMRGDGINSMNNNTNDSQQRVMQEVNAIKSWRKVYWVDLDYLQLAAAAVHCRAYFSALLYVEEWCKSAHPRKHLRLPNRSENPQRPLADAQLLEIYSKINEPDGLYAVAQSNDLLSQLRRSEREGDWASVLVTCDLAMQLGGSSTDGGENAADAGATMNATNMFSSAQTGLSREAAAAGIMRALSNMGASSLLATATQARHEFLQNTTVSSSGLNTAVPAHHASMLMSQWTPLDPGNGDPEPSDASIAAAVAALASGSAERCTQAVSAARRSLVAALATAGLESAGDVNPALVRLQMLQEISEAWDLRWPDLPNLGYGGGGVPGGQRRGSPVFGAMANTAVDAESQGGIEQSARFQHVVDRWRSKEIWAGNGDRYSLRAPLQHLRLQLLRILRAPGAEAAALEEAAVTARKTRHFGKASEYLLRLRRLFEEGMDAGDQWARKCEAPAASWRVEEAKLLWARGQPEAALSTLMALLPACNAVDQTPSDTIWPTYLHALAGKWKAATQRESSTIIYRDMMANVNHVQPSVWSQQPMMSCRVMYRLATYADSLYRGVEEHMSSSDWSTAQQVLATKKQDLERLDRRWAEKQRAGQTKIVTIDGKRQFQDRESMDLYTSRQKAQQAIEQDEEELNATIKRRDELLLVAFNAHIRSLIIGDSYDLQAVFRVIQVWLAHGTHGEIVGIFGNYIPNVASRKLLPLVYQIASRLSASREGPLVASGFQSSLQNLLVRLGTEHPFHTLPHILALKNGNRGTNGLPAPPSRSGAFGFSADEDRLKAAELVLEAVSASGDRQNAIVRDLEAVTDEYIRLAAAVPAATKAVPAALRRILISSKTIPVLSVELPVDPTMQYADVPAVSTVDSKISFPGGINMPKKLDLTDSHGQRRTQLVKGGSDDLRQDAVMEQYFNLLNAFLQTAPATSSRDLHIRTFKVLPMSPAAGLLEWVHNTAPIGEVITASSVVAPYGYANYASIRGELMAAHESCRSANKNKLRASYVRPTFDQIASKMTPVLHHHFLERYREPGAWFEARLSYTRSVAASSMAGHIIGLGDRHTSNILLDTSTSEVVHIDLGIAFEQGKHLATPERVPFRLTRNLVDGMGVTGVEGAMRRCCEATLRVLRDQREPLLTLLEVFVHDPLYKWGLTFKTAARRQPGVGGAGEQNGEGKSMGNVDANRTLLRIRQKLEGKESGDIAARSVEGQVAHLLQEAMDEDNLCLMYPGWAQLL